MWRFVLIVSGTLLLSGFIWLSFYVWGYSRPIYTYDNKLLPETKIFVKTDLSKNLDPKFGLFIEVTQAEDNLNCNQVLCSELLSRIGQQSILISSDINKENIHTQLDLIFAKLKDKKQIGFVSRFPVVVSSIKEMNPTWSFGTSEIEKSRLLIFQGLGLIHIPEMKSDFWFAAPEMGARTFLNESIIEEMKRRKKAIILGPVTSLQQWELVKSLGVDAAVIEPHLLLGLDYSL